jgi:CDP-diacylglycerol--glycerol-3-phosphate 3-phosphatidyltransferase
VNRRAEPRTAREVASDAAWTARETAAEAAESVRRFGETAIKTPANAVTLVRLLFAIPVLVWILDEGKATWGTFAGWLVLWLTDGLDGWLARRDGTTRSGAFLDPLADKVLVLGAMFTLVSRDVFWIVPVLIISAREFVISVYRTVAGSKGVSVPASRMAKYKTVFQQLAVGFALWPWFALDATWLWKALLWVAVVLALLSGARYLRHTHAEVTDGATARAL